MKSVLVNYLAISLLYASLFTACKKYPEDGKLSYKTVKARLKNKWILRECFVDGVERIYDQQIYVDKNDLGELKDSVVYTLRDFTIEFSYYKHTVYGQSEKVNKVIWKIDDYLFRYNPSILYEGSNEWELRDGKCELKFKKDFRYERYFDYNENKLRLLYNQSNEPWDIRKLTNKEFVLETVNSDGKKVRLKFNKL